MGLNLIFFLYINKVNGKQAKHVGLHMQACLTNKKRG